MKIGIPNTLFSSYHYPFWRTFLENLNIDVVISDESSSEVVNRGGKLLPHEFCIPIKAFIGHVLNLLDKQVDLILIPRMISRGKANFFCPKLMGLVEIVKYSTGLNEEQLFSPEVFCNGLAIKIHSFPGKFTPRPVMQRAASYAERYWDQYLEQCRRNQQTLIEVDHNLCIRREQSLKVGLLGYAYTLYDPWISKGIIHQLQSLGASIITWEMLSFEEIDSHIQNLKRPLYWNFGRIILGAGLHFLNEPGIDGVIYVSTFGCGPDSVATKMLTLEAANLEKPLLMLNLDEHSEAGHIQTRLEAFTDMLLERRGEAPGRAIN